jgi:hypothetical protein
MLPRRGNIKYLCKEPVNEIWLPVPGTLAEKFVPFFWGRSGGTPPILSHEFPKETRVIKWN